jgi:hypothetical protein
LVVAATTFTAATGLTAAMAGLVDADCDAVGLAATTADLAAVTAGLAAGLAAAAAVGLAADAGVPAGFLEACAFTSAMTAADMVCAYDARIICLRQPSTKNNESPGRESVHVKP